MPRPKGMPKTGGRQAGTPNRRTGILVEELYSLGFHPAVELVRLIPKLEPEAQARVLLSIMGFLYSKKTATGIGFDEQAVLWRIQKAEVDDGTDKVEQSAEESQT